MKRIARWIGAALMFLNGISFLSIFFSLPIILFSGDENWGMILISMLALLLGSGVLFCLGAKLWRKNGGSFQTKMRKKKSTPQPPKTAEPAPTRPALPEGITTLTYDRSWHDLEYDEGLDSMEDGTGVNWVRLQEGADLALAVEEYLDTRAQLEARGELDRSWNTRMFWGAPTTHLRVHSKADVEALGPRQADVFRKCWENEIRIVLEQERYQYYDFVSGRTYRVYIAATWPGSTDDAATYGQAKLKEIPTEMVP